ncbi:MAG: BCD family MFS transporter [Methyloceanibacter sp.]|jgi:BCD family chlorophyll transporter-like MFS transporter
MTAGTLGWFGILRLGLVQTALGAIVVLTTSTMNRVMVVELALPAMLPGALVTLHYALQVLRPRFGYGSDRGGRRVPWIIGGMAVLAIGGVGAAVATAWMTTNTTAGVALAVAAFVLIGVGVGACGTSLLALMATHVAPSRRSVAAMVMWMMMIAGIVVTATSAGHFLDPFTPARLIEVTASVAGAAFVVTCLASLGMERAQPRAEPQEPAAPKTPFLKALGEVWADPLARGFTVFVFLSMLAYSAQDLILEPFAGTVFGMSPGETTKLAGLQHAGVLVGMLIAGLLGSGHFGRARWSLRVWIVGGCLASALALVSLAAGAFMADVFPLRFAVFSLGAGNGVFAVAAIGSMMTLASEGQSKREGTRIGLWGAAQAFAFGLGGFIGTVGVDLSRALLESPVTAYAIVFSLEGVLFVLSAVLAARLGQSKQGVAQAPHLHPSRDVILQVARG